MQLKLIQPTFGPNPKLSLALHKRIRVLESSRFSALGHQFCCPEPARYSPRFTGLGLEFRVFVLTELANPRSNSAIEAPAGAARLTYTSV